jgi:hypothetical protein
MGRGIVHAVALVVVLVGYLMGGLREMGLLAVGFTATVLRNPTGPYGGRVLAAWAFMMVVDQLPAVLFEEFVLLPHVWQFANLELLFKLSRLFTAVYQGQITYETCAVASLAAFAARLMHSLKATAPSMLTRVLIHLTWNAPFVFLTAAESTAAALTVKRSE